MRNSKKMLSLVLIFILILGTSTAFAAEGDIFLKADNSKKYLSKQMQVDILARKDVQSNENKFQIEVSNKFYDLTAANAAYKKDKANWKDILSELEEKYYTITFEAGSNGSLDGTCSISEIESGTEWDTLLVPKPVADTGYIFDGWTPEFPEFVTADATYTANFKVDPSIEYYTVRFVAGANGSLEGKTVFLNIPNGKNWRESVTVPTAVPDAKYVFKEWTPEFPGKITKNLTFTASFKRRST